MMINTAGGRSRLGAKIWGLIIDIKFDMPMGIKWKC